MLRGEINKMTGLPVKTKKTPSLERQKEIAGIILVMPTIITLIIFSVIPIYMSIKYSFTDWNGVSPNYKFIGLGNYKYVVTVGSFPQILMNTTYLMILYVPVLNILALVLAFLINSVTKKIGNFYKSLIFFPNLLALMVIGFIWKLIYNYNDGMVNATLNGLGLTKLVQDWLGDAKLVIPSISISLIWYAIGYFMVIYIAGMLAIPEELYEASSIEGVNGFQKFFYVTLPLLAPSITVNVVMSTMMVFVSFGLIFAMTEGGPGYASQTLAMEIFTYAYSKFQQGPALALAVLLSIAAVVIMLIEFKFLIKREDVY